ncbi:MAG: AraC family transcriptional regulator [Pseudomonadota bacterium]
MSIYAPSMDFTWRAIESGGHDPRPLFEEAGIDPALRGDAGARIPMVQQEALLSLIAERTGDTTLGVRSVENLHPSHLGPLGYAWLTSTSVEAALRKIERYSAVTSDSVSVEIEADSMEVVVTFDWPNLRALYPIQHFTASAVLVRLIRLLVGLAFTPLRIEYRPDAPADISPFESRFRCPIEFGCPQTRVFIAADVVNRVLPTAHGALEQASDDLVVKYLADRSSRDIVSQIKAVLVELMPEGEVSAERIAERLNMSPRTLRRRLEDEGVSFREILGDLRRERALHYIRDDSLTLTEISYLLGFSEPSSFSRAFRGWTGQSPRAARATPG